MLENLIWPVLVAAITLSVIMGVVWAIAVRIRNAGFVDVAWALNFTVLAGLYAALLTGYGPRR